MGKGVWGEVDDQRISELKALKVIAESLNQATELSTMLLDVLKELLAIMKLETGWIFLIDEEKGTYKLAADYQLPEALSKNKKKVMCEGSCWCVNKYNRGALQKATNIMECKRLEDAVENHLGDTRGITHHATVPLTAGEEKFGLLNVASPNKTQFTDGELALLESVAYQVGTAIKRIKLTENEQRLTVVAERNRLARDLHDSVNQLLFSLMLTVRGTKEMTNDPELIEMLNYMQELSQEAMSEMRGLIWQLRPQGLENGLVSALLHYGKVLSIEVDAHVTGVLDLPSEMEECLWRIGQEALNNCKKHANVQKVTIKVLKEKNEVTLTIADKGDGFECSNIDDFPSLGIASMKERAEILQGKFSLISKLGAGTTVKVTIPLVKEGMK